MDAPRYVPTLVDRILDRFLNALPALSIPGQSAPR